MPRTRADKTSRQCRRCGTCCKKGGPALHGKDRELVENGQIPLSDLYTIRCGELARDNVRGILQPLETEIIKIKSRKAGSQSCRYYAEQDSSCEIYATRPMECRALQCWDTRDIERIYNVGRLRRKDLLGQMEGLWDLIADHERRCSYEKLRQLIQRLSVDPSRTAVAETVLETIQYDAELRRLVIERGSLDPEMLDFLFGRPLTETVGQLGVRLVRAGEKITRLAIEKSSATSQQGVRGTQNP
jgi:Fe-S-cluster containining protein